MIEDEEKLDTQNYERANGLEEVAIMLQHYAKILRREEQDLTGRGYWQIICDNLGQTMDCKVIPQGQYEAFCELSEREFQRLVTERDEKVVK